jgi:hypothetical protein
MHMPGRNITDLIQTLRYGDIADRRAALAELAHVAPEASEAIPDVIAILHDIDPSLRSAADDVLAGMGSAAVAPLVAAMLEEHTEFRKAVIGTLGRIGPKAASAIPVLTAARIDPQLVDAVDAALAQIKPSIWARLRPHLVRTLPPAVWTTAALIVSVGAITALAWLTERMQPGNPTAVTVGTAIGLIGGSVGALIGGVTRGRIGAIAGLVLLGIAGYFIGVFIGGWVGSLLGPLGR